MTQLAVPALVAAPFLLAAGVLLIRHPLTVALPAFAATIPFGGLLGVGSSRFSSLSSLLGLVLVIGLVIQVLAGRRTTVPMSLTVPLWLLFLGVAGTTTLWSLDNTGSAIGFILLGSLCAIYVLVSLSPIDRNILRRTENGLLVGGIAVTCYGVAQLLFLGFPAHQAGTVGAPQGRFGNNLLGPDNEAVSLLLPLLIAASRTLTSDTRRSRLRYGAVTAFLLLGILMTGSRGGILATIAAGLTFAFATPDARRRVLSYTAAGLVLAALAFLFHPLGLADRTVSTTSTSGRFAIWRVGLAACPQYCPLGAGWESFPLVYAKTQPYVPDAQVLVGPGGQYQPHNVILLAAIELGLPGLLLLFAVFGATLMDGVRLPRSLRGPPLAALVGTLVGAMFLSNLEYKFFWMALSMVALTRNLAGEEDVAPRTSQTPAAPVTAVPSGAPAGPS